MPESASRLSLASKSSHARTELRSPIFDADYYLSNYPGVAAARNNPFQHYLDHGAARGHKPHPLFDPDWYLGKYPQVAKDGTNPLVDYLEQGWRMGRDPNPLFDVNWYLARYSDLIPEGTDPLTHFVTIGQAEGLNPHPLFDTEWYVLEYRETAGVVANPLAHFLETGGPDGYQPNPLFDSNWYQAEYSQALEPGTIPLVDFVETGATEGRNPNALFDCFWYSDTNHELDLAPVDTLAHYLEVGGQEGRKPTPLFDGIYYLNRYSDVASAGKNPLSHYFKHGAREGRYPNPLFDSGYYLHANPDVKGAGFNPLVHYRFFGGQEGRRPCELFDSQWYWQTYREVAERGTNPLEDYLLNGKATGRNPHPLFDDAYYLDRYPGVASSGMLPAEHYLLVGALEGRKPCIMFDGGWYIRTNPDIEVGGLNPLVHFTAHGAWESRWPNPLFDAAWYRQRYGDLLDDGTNPLIHYIRIGARKGCWPSPYFDPEWYLNEYPEARAGTGNPLEHFLEVGGGNGCDPHPFFDSSWYAARYMDGEDEIPVAHYIARGREKNFQPNSFFDPAWYRQRYPDIELNRFDPFDHFWAYGRDDGRFPAPAIEVIEDLYGQPCADGIAALFRRYRLNPDGSTDVVLAPTDKAVDSWVDNMVRLGAGTPADNPDVSIVIPVFNHAVQTMACIHSLLNLDCEHSFEIIVADDASTDRTAEIIDRLDGIRLVRGDTNRGFIANCNDGAAVARGRFIAFLNNDTLVLPGWLDELVDTFAQDEKIGFVGSRLLFGDGRLQEAGGIVWRDGSAWNYGRGQDPHRPEFSYLRDVDYVSGASVMVTRELWEELGGFDTWYDVAYGEDSDLAFRVREAGRRVVYQPWSTLLHFEGVTSGTDIGSGAKKYQVANARKLFKRWEKTLGAHRPNGQDPHRERERRLEKRILVVDALTPAPDEDAGSVTCFELMRAFQAAGYKVTFFAHAYPAFLAKQTKALQRIGIEVIYHPFYSKLEDYLKEHGSLIDLALVFRNECAFPLLQHLYEHAPQAKIAFHVSDLHFVREARKAELENSANGFDRDVRHTRAKEMYSVVGSDLTIVHSDYERDVLARLAPSAQVYVFPWIVDPKAATKEFSERSGITYLGGFGHPPNTDAVLYFASEIWPRIHAARPDMVFHVIGSRVPDEISKLHGRDNIQVVGYVEDLATCFDDTRISVAPVRYGAGIKGKVPMAMSYGIPVVATSCATEGMSLVDGENVIVRDDPDAFADAVIKLHDDEALWTRMSSASVLHIDQVFSTERGVERVKEIIDILLNAPGSGTNAGLSS